MNEKCRFFDVSEICVNRWFSNFDFFLKKTEVDDSLILKVKKPESSIILKKSNTHTTLGL